MADKIVQLVDKDGNNIYPLAATNGGGDVSSQYEPVVITYNLETEPATWTSNKTWDYLKEHWNSEIVTIKNPSTGFSYLTNYQYIFNDKLELEFTMFDVAINAIFRLYLLQDGTMEYERTLKGLESPLGIYSATGIKQDYDGHKEQDIFLGIVFTLDGRNWSAGDYDFAAIQELVTIKDEAFPCFVRYTSPIVDPGSSATKTVTTCPATITAGETGQLTVTYATDSGLSKRTLYSDGVASTETKIGGATIEKITATQKSVSSYSIYWDLSASIADYDALWIDASITANVSGGAAADTVPISGSIKQFVLKEGSSYPTLSESFSEAQRFTKARDVIVMTTNFYTNHFGLEIRVSNNNTGQAVSGQVYHDWLSDVTATSGSATIYGIRF